ncbi:MAG: phosphoenolpyruvate carboxykinase (ATP), partial [Pirellulales bacterium]
MHENNFDLSQYGIYTAEVWRNAAPARLYEAAVNDDRCAIADSGALVARSGSKTGRSPKDKRIVDHPHSSADIWWGDVNIPLDEQTFLTNRERAIDFLN